MTTALPLLGWTLLTGVCSIPLLRCTLALAEWLEERPDGSIIKGKSSTLVPLMSSLLAFGALAYGYGFGGINDLPSSDTEFNGDSGHSHQQSQVQTDSVGAAIGTSDPGWN